MMLQSQLGLSGQMFDQYRMDKFIGAGGMAAVYQAFDTKLERNVAIKVLPQYSQTQEYINRFEREAKAMAKLFHPNIVSIHDFGNQDGNLFLVMDLITGGTLEKRLKGLPVPYVEVVRFLLPVVYALGYAHRHGVVHRDVKPANILMDNDKRPVLSDFGIAKVLTGDNNEPITRTGVGLGTPDYIAPEQGLGKHVDGRADIYSLGVIFYEMLTGSKPFTEGHGMQIMMMHIMDPFPHPTLKVPELPKSVEKVLLKMVEKSPDDRYQTMEQLANALQELQPTDSSVSNMSGLFTEESIGRVLKRPNPCAECPQCKSATYPNDRFCSQCGTPLDAEETEEKEHAAVQQKPVHRSTTKPSGIVEEVKWMLQEMSGTHPGKQFPLDDKVTMGRSQSNAIWVNNTNASRRHACIEPTRDGGIQITDLGSTNGTWVNGRRIGEPVMLQPGDQVVVGDTEFEVVVG
ncbi:MAG: protein kinase [Anaerolineae bacterium]|jgi:serine/threonine protein kinase|nr:protein kinase [Anaerolineae bacterium]